MRQEAVSPCLADVRDGILTVRCSRIERKWSLRSDGVFPLSILDHGTGVEWLDPKAAGSAPSFFHPALVKGGLLYSNFAVSEQNVGACRHRPGHRLVIVTADCGPYQVKWHIRLYPGIPVIRQTLFYRLWTEASGSPIAADEGVPASFAKLPPDYADYIPLAPLHCLWKTVELLDVTDSYNNLVRIEEGLLYTDSEKHSPAGNFMRIRNNLNKSGLVIVKESPTAFGQLHRPSGDFHVAGKRIWATGTGVAEPDLTGGEWVECYGTAVGVYDGGELEELLLIRRYYDCLEVRLPDSPCFVLSNTWGDRSRDGRVTESFILQELEQAARLGITHVQIDDGWQKGVTANSVVPGGTWEQYYSKDAGFWDVHPDRFPSGLAPVVQRARELGIQLGLWFSPDSEHDFAYYEKDIEVLKKLWDDYDVRSFKLDGITIRSKLGEARFLRLMDEVAAHASGDVYFNLDTTNGKRLGYLYHTSGGCLFLENRYSDFRSYYPHWTLRNIWMLAPYVPAGKLQMEFLNPGRNLAVYGDDPLSPAACGIAYGFAATMFTNPLAWMELSGLSESDAETLKPLLALFNRLRHETSGGHVLPVGEEPSGTGWTGLQCIVNDREGFLLAFREMTDDPAGSFRLWGDRFTSVTLESLVRSAGRERLDFAGEVVRKAPTMAGHVEISLEKPLSFGLYRYGLE